MNSLSDFAREMGRLLAAITEAEPGFAKEQAEREMTDFLRAHYTGRREPERRDPKATAARNDA